MDNQHKIIKGYRDLTKEEIDMMNKLKVIGAQVGDAIEELKLVEGIDQRRLDIGTTDVQKGFMALIRSVARPNSFV